MALKVTSNSLGHRHQAQAPRDAARARALRGHGSPTCLPDRPEIHGMIARVPHLIKVEEVKE